MEKEDIEEFREAIQKMSDEESGETKESANALDTRQKLLEEYKQETAVLEKENQALKQENSLLTNSVDNGNISKKECLAEEGLVTESETKDEKETLPDNDQDLDDLSSIFSEDEEDLKSLVEGSETIRKALKNLRKERDFWVAADTESETSDDGDTSVSARSLRGSSVDRIQISKLLAEKEFLELKLSQVTTEKKETETKLKFLEKSESKRRHENTSARLNQSETIPRIETKMQPSKQGNYKKQAPKPHAQHHKKKGHGMSNAELLQFLQSRSISPQLVKGYEDDIALLAEENAKLGEIIDHLHINPEEEQSPRIDPMAAFMDAYEHRVPQEEYMRLESDKMRLEHLVREKDRQIKERDRIIEESKFEYEDELKLLKENMKRMEGKLREKTKQLNEYEMQILEMKSAFEEQLGNAESDLQIVNEQKMTLDEVNANLMESNKKCQIEIANLKTSLTKLNAREKEIEKKYKNELKMLEDKYLNENKEKTQLSGNLEGLMSDLMVLKNKLLEDGGKTSRMRETFEKERIELGGEALDVNPRFANLTLHLKNRGQGENSQQPTFEPQAGNQQSIAMESNDINFSLHHDASAYALLIQEQKEKIEMLENANQDLNDKLLQYNQQVQNPLIDVINVAPKSQTPPNLSSSEQSMHTSGQLGVPVPENKYGNQADVYQNQDINNNPSRPSSAMKYEMDELEKENMYLKNKLDDLGKEKMKRRELEEKNEELQEEVSQMSKKRNELQKKQETMSGEIEEMTEKVEELEKSNAKLAKEVDQLTNKIKEMEESFNDEKENIMMSFEKERERKDKELNKAFEKEREKINEMEEEIEKLQTEIASLTKENKELKNKYKRDLETGVKNDNREMEEEVEKMKDEIASLLKQNKDIKTKFNKDIENLKRQHNEEITIIEGNDQKNLIEEQMRIKLQNTIKKYEEKLKRFENEKKELLMRLKEKDSNIGEETLAQRKIDNMESPECALSFESEVPLESTMESSAQLFTPDDGSLAQENQNEEETVGIAKVLKTEEYNPSIDQNGHKRPALKPSYSITEVPLDEEIVNELSDSLMNVDETHKIHEDLPSGTGKILDTKIDASPHGPIRDRRHIDNDEIDMEYKSIVPNVQIQVELKDDGGRENESHLSVKGGNLKLEEQTVQLQKALNEKQNEILRLTREIGQFQQQLVAKNGEIALLKEREKNATVVFQNKMDDNTKYYQDLLEKLKSTLQGEKKELEERLNKDSEEMQRLMKEEFQKSLTSKSGVLENKLQELVADKVKAYKEQIKKLDDQLQDAKQRIKQFEKGEDERTKRLEREKKVLRATIQALSKELNKAKHERKELKKEYKKGKADMKNAAEEERKTFEESLERAKDVQKLKLEEEMRNKYSVDVEKYEEKLERLNEEIQQSEAKMEDVVIKFKEEKFKLESDLQDSLVELESLKESQKEFKITVEEEYKRKLRKEKQNIETTLESLRQEITRLRENRQQLEAQLQQNAHYKPGKDSGYAATHTTENATFNNKEIFNRIENEYQQQLQREKEYYESKIRDLEDDYESLTEEVSHLKTKFRQERVVMKSEFEKEKAFLEERFESEKRELQASLQFRLHNMRDPRVSCTKYSIRHCLILNLLFVW